MAEKEQELTEVDKLDYSTKIEQLNNTVASLQATVSKQQETLENQAKFLNKITFKPIDNTKQETAEKSEFDELMGAL